MKIAMLSLLFISLSCETLLRGQSVTGSTFIDIDPATNIVTATCETDNDETDYEAAVSCSVYDDDNVRVAVGSNTDHAEAGYAQVVVSFTGQLGTNYTAKATHVAITRITDLPQNGGVVYYEDPFNYTYFENEGAPSYSSYHNWYGLGPEQQTRHSNIHVGGTNATGAIAPQVTVKFTGSKSSGDGLMFGAAKSGICSEQLSYFQCSDFFRYNYEGKASVKAASNWTIAQSIVSQRTRGVCNDSSLIIDDIPAGPDGPQPTYRQTVNGSPIFWLDSPADGTYCDAGRASASPVYKVLQCGIST